MKNNFGSAEFQKKKTYFSNIKSTNLKKKLTQLYCSNALPFNLVHFPKGEYPGKLTQREIISEEELSEQLDCLSE